MLQLYANLRIIEDKIEEGHSSSTPTTQLGVLRFLLHLVLDLKNSCFVHFIETSEIDELFDRWFF